MLISGKRAVYEDRPRLPARLLHTSESSLIELTELREQIVRIKDDENVPIVIVGNKYDLEESPRRVKGQGL